MKKTATKLSLIIPSMDRYGILKRTIPVLSRHSFYEIIVVDSSGAVDARKNKELCDKLHVKYYHFIGNREEAINFGAKKAKGEWIYIFDDDIVLEDFNLKIFEETVSKDYDFIHGREGSYVWVFRRDFFLRIGGYDSNLCYGDDYDITVRAYRHGRGARVANLTKIGIPVKGHPENALERNFILQHDNANVLRKISNMEARFINAIQTSILSAKTYLKQNKRKPNKIHANHAWSIIMSVLYLKHP